MRIVQVAPPLQSVPPAGYGGTERVISNLTEALVYLGHEVTLVASGDSRTAARLVRVLDRGLWESDPPSNDWWPFWARIGDVLDSIRDVDVVHAHLEQESFRLTSNVV